MIHARWVSAKVIQKQLSIAVGPDFWTMQVIMAEPILDQAFEKHVQDFLCSESYDFLKEVRQTK